MKTCNKCHKEKELKDFPAARSTKDNRSGGCKSCANEGTRNRSRKIRDNKNQYLVQ